MFVYCGGTSSAMKDIDFKCLFITRLRVDLSDNANAVGNLLSSRRMPWVCRSSTRPMSPKRTSTFFWGDQGSMT